MEAASSSPTKSPPPKRPKTAFAVFMMEYRSKEGKNISAVDIAAAGGATWEAMPSDERAKWNETTLASQLTYKEEIKERLKAEKARQNAGGVGPSGGDGPSIGEMMFWARKIQADQFRNNYVFYDNFDKKVYINSSGDTDVWEDRSIGFMWVAVCGMKSLCVAVTGDVELDRFPYTKQLSYARKLFAANVLCGIEDIAKSNEDSRQTLDKPVKKPFAVASLTPSTTDVHQESGVEASGAVKYLKERMKSGLDFSRTEAIQTAISALQHHYNLEFTSTHVWVGVLVGGNVSFLMGAQVEEHLTEMNKPKPLQTTDIAEQASTPMEPPLNTNTNETEEGAAPLITDQ